MDLKQIPRKIVRYSINNPIQAFSYTMSGSAIGTSIGTGIYYGIYGRGDIVGIATLSFSLFALSVASFTLGISYDTFIKSRRQYR